jgi:hypothetical protein
MPRNGTVGIIDHRKHRTVSSRQKLLEILDSLFDEEELDMLQLSETELAAILAPPDDSSVEESRNTSEEDTALTTRLRNRIRSRILTNAASVEGSEVNDTCMFHRETRI